MSPTDSELIARVVATDDHAAFRVLIERYQSSVRSFLRYLTRGDAALADDLAQETFVSAYRSLVRFRADAEFATWLLGIARNHWRNSRRRRRFAALTATEHCDEVRPTNQASDLRQDLAQAMAALSDDEQLALHVCYQQGLTHDEAAALLDWPIGTVKTHVARGKTKLRSLLTVWNPLT